METRTVQVGDVLIGSRENIVIQTMCNTHTNEVEATVEQCRRMAAAGAQLIRITADGVIDPDEISFLTDIINVKENQIRRFIRPD